MVRRRRRSRPHGRRTRSRPGDAAPYDRGAAAGGGRRPARPGCLRGCRPALDVLAVGPGRRRGRRLVRGRRRRSRRRRCAAPPVVDRVRGLLPGRDAPARDHDGHQPASRAGRGGEHPRAHRAARVVVREPDLDAVRAAFAAEPRRRPDTGARRPRRDRVDERHHGHAEGRGTSTIAILPRSRSARARSASRSTCASRRCRSCTSRTCRARGRRSRRSSRR